VSDHKTVYLDYAASAPRRPHSLAAETAYEGQRWAGANPNSLHTLGREAARALDGARADIARCLGGRLRPSDVAFTSGGTESNNLAVLGLAEGGRGRDGRRRSVVISAIEHDSVLDLVPSLHDRGFDVVIAGPGRDGVVSAATVASLVGRETALVSVMYANNETGVIQPIPEIAQAAHAAGAIFHTDAVQAFGRIPMDLSEVDAASVAAHKIGGPVGVGALAMRGRVPFRPQGLWRWAGVRQASWHAGRPWGARVRGGRTILRRPPRPGPRRDLAHRAGALRRALRRGERASSPRPPHASTIDASPAS